MAACSHCGSELVAGAAYCTTCGSRVSPTPPVGTEPPSRASESTAHGAMGGEFLPGHHQLPTLHAGFWMRAVAFLLDALLLFVTGLVVNMVTMLAVWGSGASNPLLVGFILGRLLIIATYWLYFALLESSPWQATLGKRAVGLRVVDMAGQRIGFWRATGRHFGKILSTLTLFIGYMLAGWTSRKQALHDLVAGCCVVNANGLARLPEQERATPAVSGTGMPGWAIVLVGLAALVPIIGAVAAIAIPAYQDYVVTAQVRQGMALGQHAKQAMHEYIDTHNAFPDSNSDIGLASAASAASSNSNGVATVIVHNGYFVVRFERSAGAPIEDGSLVFVPKIADNQLVWHCFGKEIPEEYLPGACRASESAGGSEAPASKGERLFQRTQAYYFGTGVPQNRDKALKLLRRSAEAGYAPAQNNLGSYYYRGQGVPQSFAKAAKWIRRAAEQGYAPAQNNLGTLYAKGKGVPQSDAKAALWYRRAAQQGYVEAQYHLGSMYYHGEGVSQSYARAAEWYRRAAKQGHAKAQYFLGDMYHDGDLPRSYDKAEKWYRRAAEQGFAPAQNDLGAMYDHGRGVPLNRDKAAKLYRKAAEQGYYRAQYNLGNMYYYGEGVPFNPSLALRWFRRAANQGGADAQYYLGRVYANGMVVPENTTKAAQWFRRAARQGDARSQFKLGYLYFTGKGVPQSYTKALKWFVRAARQGHVTAQFNAGVLYTTGEADVPQNLEKAAKWFRKAAKQGDTEAQYKLGTFYEKGIGVPQSDAKAAKWHQKALKQGYEPDSGVDRKQ